MSDLNSLVLDFAKLEGAAASGVTTKTALAGGPPSVDLDYVLKGGARQSRLPWPWMHAPSLPIS